jgi:hypothetical protein
MRASAAVILLCLAAAPLAAQDNAASTEERRSWWSRLNPFHSERLPEYNDPRLRGLVLDLHLSPQPVRLSEVRQLEVRLTLTNKSHRGITLDFPTDERIEIFLRNPAEVVLTKYSENHAYENDPGSVLINPGEHIDYNATIATRELTPNRVFICEVYFPQYPELRVRQKFLTAP